MGPKPTLRQNVKSCQAPKSLNPHVNNDIRLAHEFMANKLYWKRRVERASVTVEAF